MNFGLSDEQVLLQQTLRDFLAKECPPPRRREIFEGSSGHDLRLWRGLAEIGVCGLALPLPYGGVGLEILDLALAAEVLGAAACPGPFLGHVLAGLSIAWAGDDDQKERWLPALARGDALGTLAFIESGSSEPEHCETFIEGGRLYGAKTLVPFGEVADLTVVSLASGDLALLERGSPGVGLEALNGADRTRRVSGLELEGAPATLLRGARGQIRRVTDTGHLLLAADALGGAWQLVTLSAEYALTRHQFGQPIAQFQAVKHRLADMATPVETARALLWYAAHALDHLPDQAERAVALTKAHLCDLFLDVSRDAIEVHGGIGFTWDCDVQIWYKRAMLDRVFLGTPADQRERAARLAGW